MTQPPAAPGGRDEAVWAQLNRAGLIGLGSESTAVEAALVAEELAAAPVAVPFVGAGVLGPALLAAGNQSSALASAVADGERTVTVALHPGLDRVATDADDT